MCEVWEYSSIGCQATLPPPNYLNKGGKAIYNYNIIYVQLSPNHFLSSASISTTNKHLGLEALRCMSYIIPSCTYVSLGGVHLGI